MPKFARPILLALILAAASGAVAGCGSDGGPDPSISGDDAALLASKIQEIQDNVDVGSCLVAADKTDDLLADVDQLPSSVNDDVRKALENGANNLKLLLSDPDKCASQTTTTEPTTTEESTTEPTTTEKTQPTTTTQTQTQSTTTTQTQTQPNVTTTPGGSGGIGPGGL
jgi:uncharacterized phage infection (PIP) family protein YhgE